MPGYIQEVLIKFQNKATTKPQDALHWWNQPPYGAKTQYAETNNADLVDAQSTLYVQRFCGKFLYYSIAVYRTMLVALNAISTAQAHATTTTMGDLVRLINHTDTHPVATLHYHSSNMILHGASDASYLCEAHARFPLRPTRQ